MFTAFPLACFLFYILAKCTAAFTRRSGFVFVDVGHVHLAGPCIVGSKLDWIGFDMHSFGVWFPRLCFLFFFLLSQHTMLRWIDWGCHYLSARMELDARNAWDELYVLDWNYD